MKDHSRNIQQSMFESKLILPDLTSSGLMRQNLRKPIVHDHKLYLKNGIVRLEKIATKNETDEVNLEMRMSFVDPSSHIKNLAKELISILDLTNQKNMLRIMGLTFKDKELVEYLYKICPEFEIKIMVDFGNFKSVPVIADKIPEILEKYVNGANFISARHIFEHVDDPLHIMDILNKRMMIGSFLLIEVPSSFKLYKGSLFPDFWDEHKSYFDYESINLLFAGKGFEIVYKQEIDTEAETVLIVIVRRVDTPKEILIKNIQTNVIEKIEFDFHRIRGLMRNLESQNYFINFIGATHVVINFIDLFITNPHKVFIYDNSPSKKNKYVSKYSIQIQGGKRVTNFRKHDLWFSSISDLRLKLYYRDLISNRIITQIGQL